MTKPETNRSETPDVTPAVEILDSDEYREAVTGEGVPSVERPVSTTIGTGSFFGIGCTIVALLFVCVGVAMFMWRQVN